MSPFKPFRKKARRNRLKSARTLSDVSCESLEERVVLSCNIAADVSDGVDTALADIRDLVAGATLATGTLPLVGEELQNLGKQLGEKLEEARPKLVQGLEEKLTDFEEAEEAGQAALQQALNELFDSDGPLSGLTGTVHQPDVDLVNCSIDIGMTIGQQLLKVDLDPFAFDLGLPALPFQGAGKVDPDITLSYAFDVYFGLQAVEPHFYWDTSHEDELKLAVAANLAGSNFEATIGVLNMSLTDGHSGDADKHTNLSANIHFDVGGDSNNLILLSSNLQPMPSADVYLQAETSVGDGFPSITTDFVMEWNGLDGPAPQVRFENVTVDTGSAIGQFMGPIARFIDPLLEPIRPVLEILQSNVPIISDLSEGFGAGEVTVLDVIELAADTDALGAYDQLVELSATVAKALIFINKFECEGNDCLINVGTFDVSGDNGDLRSHEDANLLDLENIGQDLSNLAASDGLSLNGIANKIKNTEFGMTELGQQLVGRLEGAMGFDYEFPFFEDPTSVFQLFLGQDFDLFKLKFIFNKTSSNYDDAFEIPIGLEVGFQGGFAPDVHLELGYDTLGLRKFASGGQADDLLYGFWFTPESKVHLDAFLGAYAGVDTTFFDFGVEGRVEAGIHIDTVLGKDQNNEPLDLDQDPNKIHVDELGECLFSTEGALEAVLSAFVKIGVDLPVVGFLGVEEHFDLAGGTIVSFNNGCEVDAPNPFLIKEPARLAGLSEPFDWQVTPVKDPITNEESIREFIVTEPAGQLTLNIGPNAKHRNPNVVDNNIDVAEFYTISHVDPDPEVDPSELPEGEIIRISAFGRSETYYGVQAIVANAGADDDTIRVKADVLSPVKFSGGAGDDQLVYAGMGSATLSGDAGDDQLSGGLGINVLNGGPDNDQIVSGAAKGVSSTLDGGDGNDSLVGGGGTNLIQGGSGNDEITAGWAAFDNFLFGGDGHDLIDLGPGNSTVHAGAGDDQISWQAGDANWVPPDPETQSETMLTPPDGNLTVFGGSHEIQSGGALQHAGDSIGVKGTAAGDAVIISDLGQAHVGINIQTGNSTSRTIVLEDVENIAVDSLGGADSTTVEYLGSTPIAGVAINSSDFNTPDAAEDLIVVHGDPNFSDDLTVQIEQVGTHITTKEIEGSESEDEPGPGLVVVTEAFGGAMKISGFPDYAVYAMNFSDDLQLHTFAGDDSVTVLGITGPTLVDTGAHNDSVHVIGQTTDDFTASSSALDIEEGTGANSLHVDESPANVDTDLTLTASTVSGTLFPAINYLATGGDFSGGIALTGGMKKDHIYVQDTMPNVPMTDVHGGLGDDTFTLSSDTTDLSQGELSSIQGSVTILSGPGQNQLILNDQASQSGNAHVVLDSFSIDGLAGPNDSTLIQFNPVGGELSVTVHGSNAPSLSEVYFVNRPEAQLTLNAGAGDESLFVDGVAFAATINGGDGIEAIEVEHVLTGTVNSIVAPLLVDGGTGPEATLTLIDKADTQPSQATVTATTIGADPGDSFFGPSGNVTFHNLTQVNLFAGQAKDSLHVYSTKSGTNLLIDGGADVDNFLVDSNGPASGSDLGSIQSEIVLRGGPGISNSLILDDSSDLTDDVVTITPTGDQQGLIGKAPADTFFGPNGGLTYSGITHVNLKTGDLGSDIIKLAPGAHPNGNEFSIDGGGPTFQGLGDRLNLDLTAVAGPTLTVRDFGVGQLTSTSHVEVNFSNVELVDATSGTRLDLVLDMNSAALGGNDGSLDTSQAASGSVAGQKTLELVVNGQPAFVGIASAVNSLTVFGSGDDDTFFVQETADGLLSFGGSSPFAHSNAKFKLSGLAPTNVGLHFDGGPGVSVDQYDVALISAVNVNIFQDLMGLFPKSGVINHEGHFTMSYDSLSPIDVQGGGGTLNIDASSLDDTTQMQMVDPGTSSAYVQGDGGFETTSYRGFDEVVVVPPNGVEIETISTSEPPALPADFDKDGDVDGNDLHLWQADFGGDTDGGDFLVWQSSFSGPVTRGGAGAASVEQAAHLNPRTAGSFPRRLLRSVRAAAIDRLLSGHVLLDNPGPSQLTASILTDELLSELATRRHRQPSLSMDE